MQRTSVSLRTRSLVAARKHHLRPQLRALLPPDDDDDGEIDVGGEDAIVPRDDGDVQEEIPISKRKPPPLCLPAAPSDAVSAQRGAKKQRLALAREEPCCFCPSHNACSTSSCPCAKARRPCTCCSPLEARRCQNSGARRRPPATRAERRTANPAIRTMRARGEATTSTARAATATPVTTRAARPPSLGRSTAKAQSLLFNEKDGTSRFGFEPSSQPDDADGVPRQRLIHRFGRPAAAETAEGQATGGGDAAAAIGRASDASSGSGDDAVRAELGGRTAANEMSATEPTVRRKLGRETTRTAGMVRTRPRQRGGSAPKLASAGGGRLVCARGGTDSRSQSLCVGGHDGASAWRRRKSEHGGRRRCSSSSSPTRRAGGCGRDTP